MATKLKYQGVEDQIVSSSLHRQAIINGNFDVWQRGTSFTTSGVWIADRWHSFNPNNKFTLTRQSASDLPNSYYCIRIQRNAGETLTNATFFYYGGVETQDAVKFRGKKITLSFYARKGANFSSTSDSLKVTIRSGTGTNETFTGGFYTTGNATLINGQENVLTGSWQKFTVTTPDVLASDVSEFSLFFHWGGVGTAGAADYCEITQVQLCAGDVALPFQPKSYEEELRACLRYYWTGVVRTINGIMYYRLPSVMRTTPGTLTASAGTLANGTLNGFQITHTSNADSTIVADAEL